MRRAPVLIVEDDADIREALVLALSETGFETWSAANGRQALELLRRADITPGVILIDLMMPVMDGWQLAAGLRAEPSWANIPLVILSAAGPELAEQAAVLGAQAQLRKPIDLDELLEVVERFGGASPALAAR